MTWGEIMGAGDESAGAASVVTAGEAKALLARVDREVQRLDGAIRASSASKQFRRAWGRLLRSWRIFLDEEKGHPSRTAARMALMFASEVRQWRQALARESAPRAAGVDDGDVGAAIITPGRAKGEMEAAEAGINQLDAEIMSSRLRDAFKRAWRLFADDWRRFYEAHQTPTSAVWAGTYEKIVEYRRRARQWHLAFAREGAEFGAAGRTGHAGAVMMQGLLRGDDVGGIGGPRVDAATKLITTTEQARTLLDSAEKHLNTAWERTADVPLVAAAAGLRQVLRDGVENVRRWIAKVRPQLPSAGPITDEKLRRKVALGVVQAEDALKRVSEAVNDPELQFWPNFGAALTKVAATAQSGLPWKAIVAGAGGLLLVGAVLGRR